MTYSDREVDQVLLQVLYHLVLYSLLPFFAPIVVHDRPLRDGVSQEGALKWEAQVGEVFPVWFSGENENPNLPNLFPNVLFSLSGFSS